METSRCGRRFAARLMGHNLLLIYKGMRDPLIVFNALAFHASLSCSTTYLDGVRKYSAGPEKTDKTVLHIAYDCSKKIVP